MRWGVLGLDIIHNSMQNAKNNRSFYGWKEKSERVAYTFEMTLLLNRFVFTSEPENLKAILTSQFNDFGRNSTIEVILEDVLIIACRKGRRIS